MTSNSCSLTVWLTVSSCDWITSCVTLCTIELMKLLTRLEPNMPVSWICSKELMHYLYNIPVHTIESPWHSPGRLQFFHPTATVHYLGRKSSLNVILTFMLYYCSFIKIGSVDFAWKGDKDLSAGTIMFIEGYFTKLFHRVKKTLTCVSWISSLMSNCLKNKLPPKMFVPNLRSTLTTRRLTNTLEEIYHH